MTNLEIEERMRRIVKRRLLEEIRLGEVRVFEKVDGVMTIRIATEKDMPE